MVRPTTGRPCCWRRAATVEESTPPDMATATRPRCVSARSRRVSNWAVAFMLIPLYRAKSPFACTAMLRAQQAAPLQSSGQRDVLASWVGSGFLSVGGGEFAEMGYGGGDYVQG